MVNLFLKFKDLSFKLSADQYLIKSRDGYGAILDTVSKTYFNNLFLPLDYKLSVGEKLTIKPLVSCRFTILGQALNPILLTLITVLSEC